MGGFLIPNTTVSGGVANPGIPFHDSPNGGLYETANGGIGIALSGGAFFELDQKSFLLGYKPVQPFTLIAVAGSPFATGVNPYSVAVSPDGAHVFVANYADATLSVFALNSVTGALIAVAGSPFATGVGPI